MSRAYSMVQTISRIARVLSIVGLVISVMGVLGGIYNLGFSGAVMGYYDGEAVHTYGDFLGGFVEITEEGRSAVFVALAINYAAGAVVAGSALRYFNDELTEMTPFTLYGADEMKKLGIITVAVPLAVKLVSGVILTLFADIGVLDIRLFDGFLMLGVMFLVLSVIFRYGAGLREEINASLHTDRQIGSGDIVSSTKQGAVNSDELLGKVQSLARGGRFVSIFIIAVEILCVIAGVIAYVTPGTQWQDDGEIFGVYLTVMLVSAAVVAGFAARYFKKELAEGTPFTLSGADEIKRLGIITVAVPVVLRAIFAFFADGGISGGSFFGDFVILGIMFLVLSVIFRYGAELREEKEKNPLA